jgi:Transposase DDE domain
LFAVNDAKTKYVTIAVFFSEIGISDSTAFKLPDRLSTYYPGSGTPGGIKLFYDYDLLTGRFKDLSIGAGNESDASYLDKLEGGIKKKGLYIKDLGFYKGNHFVTIHQKEAYFLSRCKSTSRLFVAEKDGKKHPVRVVDLLKGVTQRCEREVYLDNKESSPQIRLVIEPVSDEVAEKRRKKARMKTKSMGYQVSEVALFACGYSVFITNAPLEALPTEMLAEVYFLRWQIEIIFKTWKSIFSIDKVRPMSIFRFECHLYSRLIINVLLTEIQEMCQGMANMELEISIWKTARIFKGKLSKFRKSIIKGLPTLTNFLTKLMEKIGKFGRKALKRLQNGQIKRSPFQVIKCLGPP